MNRQQFIDFVKEPQNLNAVSTILLENLVKEYPYCQTADILYTLNLYKEDNIKFNEQLKKASAYAADRKLLKQLIRSIDSDKAVSQPTKKNPAPNIGLEKVQPLIKEKEELVQTLKKEIGSLTEELAKNKLSSMEKSLMRGLLEQLEQIIEPKPAEHKKEKNKIKPAQKSSEFALEQLENLPVNDERPEIPHEDIIDKFIQEEPKISAVSKPEFFNPVDYAKQSLVDNESIVSETLARIYYEQGNLTKAIHIYKKLSLVYPEKSSFFAAQIEKIQKEVK
jgi:tetratricopeptide (TPR) repeat protein